VQKRAKQQKQPHGNSHSNYSYLLGYKFIKIQGFLVALYCYMGKLK